MVEVDKPQVILSDDHSSQFTSHLFYETLIKMGGVNTAVYHPQSNSSERCERELG